MGKFVKLLSGKNKMHPSDIYKDGRFKQIKQKPAYSFDILTDKQVDHLLLMSKKGKN